MAEAIEPITRTVPVGSTEVDETTPLDACENAASVATGGDMVACGAGWEREDSGVRVKMLGGEVDVFGGSTRSMRQLAAKRNCIPRWSDTCDSV